MRCFVKRTAVTSVTLLVAASLAVAGCGSTSHPDVASCFARHAAAGQAGTAPGGPANPAVAAAWTLPGGNLQNTRDVASAITSSNVCEAGRGVVRADRVDGRRRAAA